jgi:alanyl-tRNA synthetase
LTATEREDIERRVNEKIFEALPVHVFETPIDEARKLGATMLFGEKYGDIVRVVEIPGYSLELCGGTHVSTTAEIGAFAILSEGSVGSGARRIEAVTSGDAWAYLDERSRELDSLRAELQALRKEAKKPKVVSGSASLELEVSVRVAGEVNVIVQPVDGLGSDELLELSDRVKQRHAPAAVVLGSRENGAVHLVANFDQSVADRVSASDVVRQAAAIVGGGGGGRPTMARAGGKDPEKLPEALAEAERLILAAL